MPIDRHAFEAASLSPASVRHGVAAGPAGLERSGPHVLFLTGEKTAGCGVDDFSRRAMEVLSSTADMRCRGLVLGPGKGSAGEILKALDGARSLVCNLPLIAWKKTLFKPSLALALAKLKGIRTIVMLHEWGGLHRLRRAVYRPMLLLADRILMFSPHVRAELAADPIVGRLARKAMLVPLPPNLARPAEFRETALSRTMREARAAGRMVIGTFGAIYPGKQPEAALGVVAALKARGENPLFVYLGSFVKGVVAVEAPFRARVAELGLADNVLVSGYIASDAELFALFDALDAFLYVLPEGLTSRRGSVLASAQAGRTIVASAPSSEDEFDHHPKYRALIDSGAVRLVPREAPPGAYAEALIAARSRPSEGAPLSPAAWWQGTSDAISLHV